MCGIVGAWNRDGCELAPTILEQMLTPIERRGPDESAVWVQGALGLGSCRLRILDLSEMGKQPLVTSDGLGVLAYNGEVVNFQALRAKLESEGVAFHSTTDSEVVLQALHRWGPREAVSALNGMFAFAYWDGRTGDLWLSVDRLGIKPLYYANSGQTIVFASEMKALFQHPGIAKHPDLHALTTHVAHTRLTSDWTPFVGVRAVLPGTLVRVHRTGVDHHAYFDILRDLDVPRLAAQPLGSLQGRSKQLEDLLQESVRMHLISDAPLAMMCSGGLDSSLLTAMAHSYAPHLHAYVADVDGTSVREADKAATVCRHIGLNLRTVPITRESFLSDWPACVQANDQPLFFPQNIASRAIARAARRDGIKVLVGGEGADELFGGYPWHAQAYKAWHRYDRQQRLSRLVPGIRHLMRLLAHITPPDIDALARHPLQKPATIVRGRVTGARAWATDSMIRLHRERDLFALLKPVHRVADRAFLTSSFEDIHTHLRTSLGSHDKMTMSQSVELRVPFLENALIDFALHTSVDDKFHKGARKWLLKDVARRYLPADIVDAPKIGFGIGESLWTQTEYLLRDGMVADWFKWGATQQKQIISMIATNTMVLFHMVSMELWARIHFGGTTPDQLSEHLLAHK